jgi:hypothetical protein
MEEDGGRLIRMIRMYWTDGFVLRQSEPRLVFGGTWHCVDRTKRVGVGGVGSADHLKFKEKD